MSSTTQQTASPIGVHTAFDERFSVPAAVMMVSCLHHLARDRSVRFYLSCGPLPATFLPNLEKSLRRIATDRFSIVVLPLDFEELESIAAVNRGPQLAYARLQLDRLMRDDRVIHIDPDIVVQRNIAEIWDAPVEGLFAACVDPQVQTLGAESTFARKHGIEIKEPVHRQLGLRDTDPYANSGFMDINLGAWRRERIGERSIKLLLEHPEACPYWDQSALNLTCATRWAVLGEEWNLMVRQEGLQPSRISGSNLHFAGNPKPWNAVHTMESPVRLQAAEVYYKFLRKTPWAKTEPSAVGYRLLVAKNKIGNLCRGVRRRLLS